jgi:nitrogen fixation NifU-like protein
MTAALSDSERSAVLEELARSRFGAGLADAPAGLEAHRRSPSCGDEFTVRVVVAGLEPDAVITSLHWDGHGCVVSTAAAATLARLASGVAPRAFPSLAERYFATLSADYPDADRTPDPELGDSEAFAGIGRFPLRAGCASLAWRAALDALDGP